MKKAGSPINGDDYMADITGAMWADWGRGDLELIKELGGNTIRMYGNDANTSHRAFLDRVRERHHTYSLAMFDDVRQCVTCCS